ncbi:class I SAM-dependent methyltransferase [Nocardia sp. NPDC051463]|uniref:class I SAM-dependent methyltransferase n=1 Tax=Nocardia sp. NPDC051463 TaxID=3154845 RepID=UPI00342D51B4
MDGELHARAAASFGAQACAYAEHRPDYPAAVIHWALEQLGRQRSLVVLDLGAGTGKLTAGLLGAGAEPIAVEPDTEMRGELIARHPEVTTIAGTAESIPPPKPGDHLPEHPLFLDFERAEFPHAHRRTAESLTTTIGTHSHTLVITAPERAELLGRILDYPRSRPETADGEFDVPLVTDVIRAVRRAETPVSQRE